MSKRTKIYEEITETLDDKTGAIAQYENKRVFKYDAPDQFIMFFTNNMASLNRLDNMEAKVLFAMLNNFITFRNSIDISANTKKKISSMCDIHRVTLSKAIKGLIDKEVLIKIEDETTGYYLNPFVFGKGKWSDIVKLRQNLQLEFDFVRNEAIATITATSIDKDGQDILSNPEKYNIVDTKINQTSTGSTHDIVVVDNSISEKENILAIENKTQEIKKEEVNNQFALQPTTINQNSRQVNELELIKEKNKTLELENKQLKLQIELEKMKKSKKETSLFDI